MPELRRSEVMSLRDRKTGLPLVCGGGGTAERTHCRGNWGERPRPGVGTA